MPKKIIHEYVLRMILPIALAIIGYLFSQALKEREIRVKYIEIAVDILSQQPSIDDSNIRAWAVEVINNYSDIKLENTLIQKLTDGALTLPEPNTPKVTSDENKILNRDLLDEELSIKKLQNTLCNAKSYLVGGGIEAPVKACQLFRSVIEDLSISAKKRLNHSLLMEANEDYDNGYYSDSAIKYKILFKDFYKDCE